jgi:hypothetical protein
VAAVSADAPSMSSRRASRAVRIGGLLCIAGLLVCATPVSPEEAASEYEIKAAFLFNFTHFVEWPAAVFAAPDSPFLLGVLGTDPFGPRLDRVVDGKTYLATHPIRVERYHSVDQAHRCQVLYIAASEKEFLRQILEALAGAPILTVSDTEDFARNGGHIQMITVDNRMRFEVNIRTAETAKLKIGSKLLRLATFVYDGKR